MTSAPSFSTDITVGKNGQEVRNANWEDAKWEFNAKYLIRSRDDAYTLYKFFLNCYGRETAFLVQDAFDYKIPQTGATFQSIGTGNGVATTFQIKKTYVDDFSNTYSRNIYRPSATTSDLAVKVNNVLKTYTTHYTYSATTGIITFLTAPPNGHDVSITLARFNVFARFDIDKFPIDTILWVINSGVDYSLEQLPDIPIIEVRE